jgi:hypothetical protein
MSLRKLSWWERLTGWVEDDPDKIYTLTLTVSPPVLAGGTLSLPELTDKHVVGIDFISATRRDGFYSKTPSGQFVLEGLCEDVFVFDVGARGRGFVLSYFRDRNQLRIFDTQSARESYTLKFYYRRKTA